MLQPPVTLRPVDSVQDGKRGGSDGLRYFVASLRRYDPLLVVNLGRLNDDEEEPLDVLVVTDNALDWATADRLSDGSIQPIVYDEAELAEELSRPDSPLAQAVAEGEVLYKREGARTTLLIPQ